MEGAFQRTGAKWEVKVVSSIKQTFRANVEKIFAILVVGLVLSSCSTPLKRTNLESVSNLSVRLNEAAISYQKMMKQGLYKEGISFAREALLLAEELYGPDHLVDTVKAVLQHSAAHFKKAEFVRTEMWRSLAPILETYDVLICPTLAIPTVRAEHDPRDATFEINGSHVDSYDGWYLTYQFNILSQLPVISVPSGVTEGGLPTGLQIIGKTYDDVSVFRAASAFEQVRPWSQRRPLLENKI